MTKNRILATVLGIVGLALVYVFQHKLFFDPFMEINYVALVDDYPEFSKSHYIFSKLFRFILNDGFAMLLIYGLFGGGKYVKFAALVLLFGLVVMLPAYLLMVLVFPEHTFGFTNHLHRLVLNPVLMMLLIPAFYAQKANAKNAN